RVELFYRAALTDLRPGLLFQIVEADERLVGKHPFLGRIVRKLPEPVDQWQRQPEVGAGDEDSGGVARHAKQIGVQALRFGRRRQVETGILRDGKLGNRRPGVLVEAVASLIKPNLTGLTGSGIAKALSDTGPIGFAGVGPGDHEN